MSGKLPLIIIGGPTGVGKTSLSVRLAGEINAEIISADSMQIYKGFDIGTAKTRPEEMRGIKHYLIDELSPNESFSVYEFKKRAENYMKDIRRRGKIPIIAGGTGFYIQAVLYDINFPDAGLKNEYENFSGEKTKLSEAESMDAADLYEMLKKEDPESAKIIHPNNKKRILRALTFKRETGIEISKHNKAEKEKTSPYDFIYFVLTRPRSELYERINLRVDKMLEAGLEREVKELLESGVDEDSAPMQGLGYRQLIGCIKGENTLEEAAEKVKTETRHYAKRQLTWFKREKDAVWVDVSDEEAAYNVILSTVITHFNMPRSCRAGALSGADE